MSDLLLAIFIGTVLYFILNSNCSSGFTSKFDRMLENSSIFDKSVRAHPKLPSIYLEGFGEDGQTESGVEVIDSGNHPVILSGDNEGERYGDDEKLMDRFSTLTTKYTDEELMAFNYARNGNEEEEEIASAERKLLEEGETYLSDDIIVSDKDINSKIASKVKKNNINAINNIKNSGINLQHMKEDMELDFENEERDEPWWGCESDYY